MALKLIWSHSDRARYAIRPALRKSGKGRAKKMGLTPCNPASNVRTWSEPPIRPGTKRWTIFSRSKRRITLRSLAVTVNTDVAVNQIAAFERNVPIDLTSIFTGYGPLPAVTGTKDQTGAWDGSGQTRTVLLSDGSSAQEMLTQYEHPDYFSYTVSEFTGALRFLVTSANGEWWFSSTSSTKTHIKWRYAFNPRSAFAVPILWFITNVLWRGYMHKALRLFKAQVEHNAT